MSHECRAAAAGLVVLTLGVAARPALACSYAPSPASFHGLPRDGQQDVPTDAVPVYDLSALYGRVETLSFELRAEGGGVVETVVTEIAARTAEVRPLAPLEPFTSYVLETNAPSEEAPGETRRISLTFTTGAGPLLEPPAAPVGLVQHYRFAPGVELFTCDPTDFASCVALPEGELIEYQQSTASGDRDTLTMLTQGPFLSDLRPSERFSCLRLRRRAINGVYSEPTMLCGADAVTLVLAGNASLECTPSGILHDGPVVEVAPVQDTAMRPDAGAATRPDADATARGESRASGELTAPDLPEASDDPEGDAGLAPRGCVVAPSAPRAPGLALAVAALLIAGRRRRLR